MQRSTGVPPMKKILKHYTRASTNSYTQSTCIRSVALESELALWMRYVCSMYSVSRCRKLSGSLNITGIVIFDSS